MKTIILVEDDSGIQEAISLLLENQYNTTVFSNGDVIFDESYDVPDLFILDKQLPGVSGIDICRHLKQSERTRSVPVVILSASPDVRKQASGVGADSFLEKPFTAKDFKAVVASFA